jgi:hypothetical protein
MSHEVNQPPTAAAGQDTVITLPVESVSLDSNASSDPDGEIKKWLWTKVAGPASFTIAGTTSPKTLVNKLTAGIYQFELMVTDDKGLSAKDMVQITVDDPRTNQPPVACAGTDQVITLPTNSVTLDGTYQEQVFRP